MFESCDNEEVNEITNIRCQLFWNSNMFVRIKSSGAVIFIINLRYRKPTAYLSHMYAPNNIWPCFYYNYNHVNKITAVSPAKYIIRLNFPYSIKIVIVEYIYMYIYTLYIDIYISSFLFTRMQFLCNWSFLIKVCFSGGTFSGFQYQFFIGSYVRFSINWFHYIELLCIIMQI